MQNDRINTSALLQLISQIKAAEQSHQREIRIDIASAKNIKDTLALVMTRLAGNYEGLIQNSSKNNDVEISVQMDGGSWDKK